MKKVLSTTNVRLLRIAELKVDRYQRDRKPNLIRKVQKSTDEVEIRHINKDGSILAHWQLSFLYAKNLHKHKSNYRKESSEWKDYLKMMYEPALSSMSVITGKNTTTYHTKLAYPITSYPDGRTGIQTSGRVH